MQQRHHANANFLCSELVNVKFIDDSGQPQIVSANLEEISHGGMTLLIDRTVPIGTPVSLEAQGHTLRGRITHTEHDDLLGWYLGVKLSARSPWSPDLFVPDHLLAVPRSARLAPRAA
jgi:hypothetical protein